MRLPPTTLSALLLGFPSALTANGFRVVSQDAFAAARGEAFAATADNPSAIYYNPAGISQLKGQQFRLGSYALHFDPTFQAPDVKGRKNAGEQYEIEKKNAFAPQLYYTYGMPDCPVTLGLGVYAPHGAGVTWPQDTGFRTVAIDGELTYLRINPVVAVEIRPGLSFAMGVMFDDASFSSGQGLRRTEVPLRNSFKFEGDALSLGYNLGLLWQINEQWSVGTTFRSPSRLDFKGQTKLEFEPFVKGVTKNPAEMDLEFPCTAVVGVSYRPTKRWNIEFNADYTNWSTIDTTTIQQAKKPPFPVLQDIPVTLEWKDSWILKFGATRYFDEGWRVSAGYVFDENSVPSSYYSPVAADLDRHFLTLGVGREWSRYSVDFAYQFGFALQRKVAGSTPSSIPALAAGQNGDGTYDFTSHAVLLSFGMSF